MSNERRRSVGTGVLLVLGGIWATTALLSLIGRTLHMLVSGVITLVIIATLVACFITALRVPRSDREDR